MVLVAVQILPVQPPDDIGALIAWAADLLTPENSFSDSTMEGITYLVPEAILAFGIW